MPDAALLTRALEAVIFASSEPLPLTRLRAIFEPDGAGAADLEAALSSLMASCAERGIELAEVAGGYQFRTRAELGPWVARLEVARPVKFSRAAMEALAVVAYRQPVTRAEIEEVRGVDCGAVLKSLLEKGLIRIVGKKDVPGRPLLYGTTKKFLEAFGLASLGHLPSVRDLQEVLDQRAEGVADEASGGEG